MKPAVFLDRDGVINETNKHVAHVSEFEFYPQVFEALRLLEDFHLVIVTNQSGLSTGLVKKEHYDELTRHMLESLKEKGINIKGVYECPHADEEHYCRKPNIGMVEKAVKEHDIDLTKSFVVGDSSRDIRLANNLGIPGILVKTGLAGMDGHVEHEPHYVAENILDAARYIKERFK